MKTVQELTDRFTTIKDRVGNLAAFLDEHAGVFSKAKIDVSVIATELRVLLEKTQIPAEYKVGIVGRFKAGKSAFVNELIGHQLAAEHASPETAAVTTFIHSETVGAKIRFIDKARLEDLKAAYAEHPDDPDSHRISSWESFKGEALENFEGLSTLKELEAEFVKDNSLTLDIADEPDKAIRKRIATFTSAKNPLHCLVEEITIFAPSKILNDGVRLIDTPGLDDTDAFRVDLTTHVVKSIDAILFLTKSGGSYGQSEKEFLLSVLRNGNIKQLIVVVTQIDQAYQQVANQAEDMGETVSPILDYISKEKTRLKREIQKTLDNLSENADSVPMKSYREQLGEIEIVFTSARNHRDATRNKAVPYPIFPDDAGGLKKFNSVMERVLSSESRIAVVYWQLNSGIQTIIEDFEKTNKKLVDMCDSKTDKEVTERALSIFRDEVEELSKDFIASTKVHHETLKQRFSAQKELVAAKIENISLRAERVLAALETNDIGLSWQWRRHRGWGYMNGLQAQVANQIFPSVAELLHTRTEDFAVYIKSFGESLLALSNKLASPGSIDEVNLNIKVQLEGFLKKAEENLNSISANEQKNIIKLLDQFVTDAVAERLSNSRKAVSAIAGKGTKDRQAATVRDFYDEIKKILTDAVETHVLNRHTEYAAFLLTEAEQLPFRALQYVKEEIIRARAGMLLSGPSEGLSVKDVANKTIKELEDLYSELNSFAEALKV